MQLIDEGESRHSSREANWSTQADFYRDGLRVDKMLPISAGSNPTTLKVTIEVFYVCTL